MMNLKPVVLKNFCDLLGNVFPSQRSQRSLNFVGWELPIKHTLKTTFLVHKVTVWQLLQISVYLLVERISLLVVPDC